MMRFSKSVFLCFWLTGLVTSVVASAPTIEGLEWRLMTLGDSTVPTLPGERQPSLKLDPEQKRVTGYAGCNNFFGSYELAGASLRFGPLAATRRACFEPASSVEMKYLGALARVRGWKLDGGELLLVANGEMLARFAAQAAGVSIPGIEALTFRSGVYKGGPVKLTHGEYRTPAAPGSASEVIVRLSDKRAFGLLNGKQTGAVVVTTSLGGTGTFYELALLSRQGDGWTSIDAVQLGDRVRVHAVAIDNNQIIVAMTTHGPKDPMCCPTLEVRTRWSVRDGRLLVVEDDAARGQPSLTGTTWQWVQTLYNNDKRTAPAKPGMYTIRFGEGGVVDVRADCNRKGGTYSSHGKRLSINITHSTMAACEPGSLEDEFIRNIGASVSCFFRDNNLYLDLEFDSGTMKFSSSQQP